MLVRWGVQKGLSVLVKSSQPERLAANLRDADAGWALSDGDVAALDALTTDDALATARALPQAPRGHGRAVGRRPAPAARGGRGDGRGRGRVSGVVVDYVNHRGVGLKAAMSSTADCSRLGRR